MVSINWSLMNVSDTGGFTPLESVKYVTIDSCKSYVAQTEFWMYLLGFLFLASWICFCYTLYRYYKIKKTL